MEKMDHLMAEKKNEKKNKDSQMDQVTPKKLFIFKMVNLILKLDFIIEI